jgi:hypothetical protein
MASADDWSSVECHVLRLQGFNKIDVERQFPVFPDGTPPLRQESIALAVGAAKYYQARARGQLSTSATTSRLDRNYQAYCGLYLLLYE